MLEADLNLFATLLAASVAVFLGVIVFLHDKGNTSNKIFATLSLVFVLWSIANYFSLTAPDKDILFWIRSVIFLAVPQVFLLLLFVRNFPSKTLALPKQEVFAVGASMVFFMLFSFFPTIFNGVQIVGTEIIPVPGSLMPFFIIVLAGLSFFTFGLIIQKYIISRELVRRQWLSISAGFIASYLLLIFLVLVQVNFFENTAFVPYAPLFILPIFLGAAYAILRHHLFNVEVIATEILTFIILVANFVQVFFAESRTALFVSVGTFIFLLAFGILLIRSVIKEVEAREKIELLASDLEVANERLKELDQRKSEFVSLASHQLRAPLTAIKGYASLLVEGSFGVLSAKAKEATERIFESSNRLVAIVEDFLTISRIEQNRLEYHFERTDMQKIVGTIVEEMKQTAQQKGVSLSLVVPDKEKDSFVANVDAGKISQVVGNVINNAIQYAPQGTIVVTLSKNSVKKMILIAVKDNGVGMTKETIDKLFQKFSRADDASKTSTTGTGLGLYVASQLVQAHQGRIWAESAGKDKGSTFFVELPLVNK